MKRSLRFVAALIIMPLAAGSPAKAGSDDGTLDIFFIDVEGGAATLLVTPQGESILVDSGYPGNDDRDAKRIYHVATDVAGLKHLDHYMTSHWHLDHYGGIAALAEMLPVKHFWDRGIPAKLTEDAQFPERIALYRKTSRGESKTLRPGDVLPLFGSSESDRPTAKLRILIADHKLVGQQPDNQENLQCKKHEPKPHDPSDNAASMGFVFTYGEFDFLCLGDLTWNEEHRLVCPTNRIGEVDLYMVTHHGLPSSNNPVLVHSVRPRVAVACNGPTKGAHPDVIKTLRAVDGLEAIYQLHLNVGSSPEENTDKQFIANLDKDCSARFIKATVEPAGKAYRLSIGEAGPSRRYESR